MFWLAEVFNGRYTQEELDRLEQWARQRRAEAVRHLLPAAGRGLARAATAGAGRVRAAAASVVAAYGTLRRWQRRRAAIRELSGLSDHILGDIGLHRGDIRSVVDDLLDRPTTGPVGGRRETPARLRVVAAPNRAGESGTGSSAARDTGDEQQRAA